jgi:ribosome-associated protein
VDAACTGAEEKVALDLVVLDLRDLVDSFDALVIASGRNDRQVRAIAEEIEHVVARDCGARPLRVEGMSEGQWVAIDYGDVIVHVFDEETRAYYDLEHLWNAARVLRRARTN